MFHTSCIHSRSFHYWCFLFIWRFKEDFVEKFEPHSEHTIPAPLVSCFIRQCLLKLVLSWYELSHNLHWNKPSEFRLNSSLVKHAFDIKCLFNFFLSLNVSLQILHCIFPSIFLSKSCASFKFMLWRPWILSLCWYRLVFELKVELHLSQVMTGPSPVCLGLSNGNILVGKPYKFPFLCLNALPYDAIQVIFATWKLFHTIRK